MRPNSHQSSMAMVNLMQTTGRSLHRRIRMPITQAVEMACPCDPSRPTGPHKHAHKPLQVHVYFHVDSIVKQEELLTLPGWELIQKHLAPRQYRSSWSSPGLAKTELKLMRDLLHMHPKASHVMIAGGTHLPVLIDPFKHCKPNESWLPNMNLDNGFPICLGNGVLLAQDRMMKNPLTAHYWRSLGIVSTIIHACQLTAGRLAKHPSYAMLLPGEGYREAQICLLLAWHS